MFVFLHLLQWPQGKLPILGRLDTGVAHLDSEKAGNRRPETPSHFQGGREGGP